MRTFRRKGRPVRRSLGVLAAPEVVDFSLEACAKEVPLSNAPDPAKAPIQPVVAAPSTTTVPYRTFAALPVDTMKKLGESTFSEIFVSGATNSLFKVIPLADKKEYKRVQHTKTAHFIKEAMIMERMNASPYSAKLLQWSIVTGTYPKSLIQACKDWAAEHPNEAENVIPQKNNSSGVFGVIEMEYGGVELAKVDFAALTAEHRAQIISGIRKAVVQMNQLGVEHRDMHESNLLVLQDAQGKYSVRTIDYSLSRASWNGTAAVSVNVIQQTPQAVVVAAGRTLYTDIDDGMGWLFEGTDGEPHREVYRKMDAAYTGPNRWEQKGDSNYFWLLYLIDWISKRG